MSLLPRRTTEFIDMSGSITNSALQTNRVSRIAVRCPRQKASSLDRQKSMDRYGSTGNLYMPVQPPPIIRSSSATPMRTPNRPRTSYSLTATSTAEKRKANTDDKRWLQQQSVIVTEYLRQHEALVGKEFSARGGLRSMSTKQFVIIVTHLIHKCAGSRIKIGANYVDDVAKILSSIEYPYNINKSWLKTPSAPHSFNNIIVLLSWLVSFASVENVENFQNDFSTNRIDFPSHDYQNAFAKGTKEAYRLWNNGKDEESEGIQNDLLNDFIKEKVGFESIQDLENELKQIRKEIGGIKKIRTIPKVGDVKRQHEMEKDVESLRRKITVFEEELREADFTLQQFRADKDHKESQLEMKRQTIKQFEDTIASQRMSVQERDNLITEINELKQIVDAERKAVLDLQDMGTSGQVQRARIVKRRSELLVTLNTYLYKIFTDLNFIYPEIDVRTILIDQAASTEELNGQVEKLTGLLQQVRKKTLEMSQNYQIAIADLKLQSKKAALDVHDILAIHEKKVALCETRVKELQEHEAELLILRSEKYKEQQESVQILNEILKKNEEFSKKMKNVQMAYEKLAQINEQVFKERIEFLKEHDKVLAAQNKQLEKANDKFKKVLESSRRHMFE